MRSLCLDTARGCRRGRAEGGEREGEKRRKKGFVVGFGVMDPKIAITEVRSSRLDTAKESHVSESGGGEMDCRN